MDWNLIRSYLMVAEHGSTAAASRHLSVTQSTISRHLIELEKQLSVQLFDRRKTGLALTDKGRELLSMAQRMETIAEDLQAQASHYSSTVSGTVRISASEVIALDVLPFCLSSLLAENPDLQIDIVSSNEASNLLAREADIAIRMFQPTQQDLIARHLLDIEVAFYAHQRYLDEYGQPEAIEELANHRFIGFDLDTMFLDGAKRLGIQMQRSDFQLRSDSIGVQTQCTKAGLGLSIMQVKLAGKEKDLKKIDPGFALPALPLYLVAQQEMRVSRKVRTVYQGLADSLVEFYN